MKRKHHCASSSSSSSCSSSSSSSSPSSSCIDSPPIRPEKGSKKRAGPKKIPTAVKSRSSVYRGVTRHRWTGRYEAHLWDKTTWNTVRNKKGRQVYLGAYDNEGDAGRTYDLAALKYWGPATTLNFPLEAYSKDLEEMEKLSKEEYLASLRRRSSGFSRGVSKYRGVARHHHNGRWEARIGRVCGNKYLYLGTYSTQEEAAAAYDMAAIEYRGPNAVTNFDISNYAHKLTKILPEVQLISEEIQVKQEMNPNPINNVQVDEAHDEADQVVKPSTPVLETPDTIDSQPMGVMDPSEDHEHPWDLCLDIGCNVLQIPHIPLEISLEEFNYKGFEDNIEFIFDDNELVPEGILGSIGCKADEAVLDAQEVNGQDHLASPSLSSLSTATSVCRNI